MAAASELEQAGPDESSSCPREWQRFCLGYAGRFVEDCVLQLNGGTLQVASHH